MTTKTQRASERITEEVTSWPGVTAGPGDRGEFGFTVGRRRLGHLHGDRVAHFGFPKDLGAELRRQGRVGPHPVAPDKVTWASRSIESDEDVRDVIALLRLNYDRVVTPTELLPGLFSSPPEPLPFAQDLDIRSFVLRRDAGDLLVYSTKSFAPDVARQYLNHGHEAIFASPQPRAPLFVHEADRASVAKTMDVRATFTRRHPLDDDFEAIPTPGHTAGATAYLWDNGERRFLFTGDTIYLRDGEWIAAVLDSSDRAAYIESLDLIRSLDFDVLVPWASTRGRPPYALTGREDAHRRIGAILDRLWRGEDH